MQKRQFFLVISATLLLLSVAVFMTASSVPPANDGYELVFSDEFNLPNGSQPDPAKWVRSQRNPSTWARWISPSPDVAYIKNGCLVCRAIPNKSLKTDTAHMLTGAVESLGKFDFKYGKVEVRMKTNLRRGNFPAVWLKPSDMKSDPRYAEIDIVETYGDKRESHHTIHTHQTYTLKKAKPTEFARDLNVNRWHVYGIEWSEDRIVWTVDGKQVGVYRKAANPQALREGQWTFDRAFYLRLNQSVGDGSHPFFTPQLNKTYETQFDWIRVYQRQ